MAETLIEFLVEIGLDPDNKALSRFNANLDQAKQSLSGMVKIAGGAAAAVGTLGAGLFSAAKKTADQTIALQRQSEAIGIARQEYQLFSSVFEGFGVDQQSVQDAFSVLADRAEDATRGTKSFVEAFNLIGIEAQELEGLEPEEIFFKTAEAISQAENDTRRLAAAERLLGGDLGQKLMPVLQMGEDNLRGMTERLRNLGTVIEDDTAKQAKQFDSTMFFLNKTWEGFTRTIGSAALPAINDISGSFLDWFAANQKVIEQEVGELVSDIADDLKSMAEAMVPVIEFADDVAESLGGWVPMIQGLAATISSIGIAFFIKNLVNLGSALIGMASNLGGVLAGISASTAGWAAAAVGVVLVLEDILAYFQGRDSLTGRFIEWLSTTEDGTGILGELESASSALAGVWEQVKNIAEAVWPVVRVTIEQAWDAFATTFGILWNVLQPVLELALSGFKRVFSTVEVLLLLLQGKWGKAWEEMRGIFTGFADDIDEFAMDMVNGLIDSFGDFFGLLERNFKRISNLALGTDFEIGTEDKGGTSGGMAQAGPAPPGLGATALTAAGGSGGTTQVKSEQQNVFNIQSDNPERTKRVVREEMDKRDAETAKRVRENVVRGSEQ